MKRSVILTDRLGPDILSAFWTKGQVLHRERAHLKVPGCSIVLNVLLNRKLINQVFVIRKWPISHTVPKPHSENNHNNSQSNTSRNAYFHFKFTCATTNENFYFGIFPTDLRF